MKDEMRTIALVLISSFILLPSSFLVKAWRALLNNKSFKSTEINRLKKYSDSVVEIIPYSF